MTREHDFCHSSVLFNNLFKDTKMDSIRCDDFFFLMESYLFCESVLRGLRNGFVVTYLSAVVLFYGIYSEFLFEAP